MSINDLMHKYSNFPETSFFLENFIGIINSKKLQKIHIEF